MIFSYLEFYDYVDIFIVVYCTACILIFLRDIPKLNESFSIAYERCKEKYNTPMTKVSLFVGGGLAYLFYLITCPFWKYFDLD